jgi:hypothetical protein
MIDCTARLRAVWRKSDLRTYIHRLDRGTSLAKNGWAWNDEFSSFSLPASAGTVRSDALE